MRLYCGTAFFAFAGFIAVIFSATAEAQIPPAAEPGIQMRGLERREPPPAEAAPVLSLPEALPGPSAEGEKLFRLEGVVLDGTTVYQAGELDELYRPYLGREVTLADLHALAADVTRRYRRDGYIFSSAILPGQEIDAAGGVVHLQAIEGRITQIDVTGDVVPDRYGLVARMAEGVKNGDGPLRARDLERALLLIGDLPGIDVSGVVEPGETPGAGRLVLALRRVRVEGMAGIDNRGSRSLGPWRGEASGALNGFLGLHERTSLRGVAALAPSEMSFVEIRHEMPVGAKGLRLAGRAALSSNAPGGRLTALDINGESRELGLQASYPLVRGRRLNLSLDSGATYLDSRTSLAGVGLSRDRLGRLGARALLDFLDRWSGSSEIEAGLTRGIGLFNPTSDGAGRSRTNAAHDFSRLNLGASRVQGLGGAFSLLLQGTAQFSDGPLLASEELALGGADYGRAYDAGEVSGDDGFAGVVELRRAVECAAGFVQGCQIYGFYDVGRVRNKRPVAGESATDSLASAGGGLRFALNHGMSGYAELAVPLTRPVSSEGDDDFRVFFSISKQLNN